MANREFKEHKKERADFVEMHPNPHGEQIIDEASIQADHRAGSDENVSRNPNTVENRMNPSVLVQDQSTDSMFNLADPQTRELLKEDSDQAPRPRQQRRRHSGRRKTA